MNRRDFMKSLAAFSAGAALLGPELHAAVRAAPNLQPGGYGLLEVRQAGLWRPVGLVSEWSHWKNFRRGPWDDASDAWSCIDEGHGYLLIEGPAVSELGTSSLITNWFRSAWPFRMIKRGRCGTYWSQSYEPAYMSTYHLRSGISGVETYSVHFEKVPVPVLRMIGQKWRDS